MRLWGGRFAGGPSPRRSRALSVSRALRLAARAVRPRRPRGRTPASCTAPACSTDDELDRDARRPRRPRAAVRGGAFRPTVADEDVHTALERGLLERARRARRQAPRRPQPQRPGRHRPAALPARPRRAGSSARLVELETRCSARPSAPRRRPVPGHDPPAARPAGLFAHQLLAHVQALAARRRAAARLGHARRASRRSAPARWPARRCRSTRRRSPRSSASTRPAANSIDAVADRDFAAEFLFVAAHDRRPPVAAGRGGRPLGHQEFGWASLDDAYSTGSLDHAAEEEPRRRRAGARQVRPPHRQPHGAARHAQGPAARLQPRPAGGQGAGVRHRRHPRCCVLPAVAGMVATMRVRHRAPRAPAAATGFALATDLAEWLVRTGVPFRDAHEVVRRGWCAGARARHRAVGRSPTTTSRRSPSTSRPEVRAVLSVRGALASRSTYGGTSPARVAEQLAALADAAHQQRRLGGRRVGRGPVRAARCPLSGSPAHVLRPPGPRGRARPARRRRGAPRLGRRGRGPAHRGRGLRR